MRGARGQQGVRVVKAITGVTTSGAISDDAYVRICSISMSDSSLAKATYQEAVAVLRETVHDDEDEEEMDEEESRPSAPKKRKL